MKVLRCYLFVALVFLAAPISSAFASPILTVDPGVQSVGIGDVFSVDVKITGVDFFLPLNAFQFDLEFNPAVIVATSITDGAFLPFPFFALQNDVSGSAARYAATGLGTTGSGSGVLATVTFQALASGNSSLHLNDVVLSSWAGIPIVPQSITDGTVNVTGATTVPAPSAWLLILSGICYLLFFRKFRTKLILVN